jgi:hypothetical protein
MSESALAKKLKLKAGQRAAVLNAPEGYLNALLPLPEGVELLDHAKVQVDWAQLFVSNRTPLLSYLRKLTVGLKYKKIGNKDTWPNH